MRIVVHHDLVYHLNPRAPTTEWFIPLLLPLKVVITGGSGGGAWSGVLTPPRLASSEAYIDTGLVLVELGMSSEFR